MLRRLLLSLLTLFVFSVVSAADDKRFTLVIDAGHGGKDVGALGSISKEKNINLTVALAFGRYVERNCPDVRVIYTRKTDVFIPLMERANIANRNKADLFVSVHTNALAGGKISRGFETYTLGMHRAGDNLDVAKRENSVILVEKDYKQNYQGFNPNSSESYIMFEFIQSNNMARSVELAKLIQNNVCSSANRPDKGVHQAGFLVLRETSMPSCLIELGFITTPDEEQQLNTDDCVDKIAYGIYMAFRKYKDKYDGKIVIPYKANNAQSSVPKIVEGGDDDAPKRQVSRRTRKPSVIDKVQEKSDSSSDRPAPKMLSGKPDSGKMVLLASDKKNDATDKPVFKVQIIASSKEIKRDDALLKGLNNVDYYKEGNMVKYTYGSSIDYNEIYRLRKQILDKFPEAFIIAFKNGTKMNVSQAIREFKQK